MCYLIEVTEIEAVTPKQQGYTHSKDFCIATLEEAMCGAYDRVDILDDVTGEVLAAFYDEELAYNILYWFLKNNFRFQIWKSKSKFRFENENWKWGLKNEN